MTMSGKCDIMCHTSFHVGRYNVQWRIENYSYILMSQNEKIQSPPFTTGENKVTWALSFYPEGFKGNVRSARDGFSSVFLILQTSIEITAFFELSILRNSEDKFKTFKLKERFTTSNEMSGIYDFIGKTDLLDIKTGLLENDTLVLNLHLEVVENTSDSASVRPKNTSDLNQVSEDYLSLLNSSAMSDFIITVADRQFKVHKLILSARSPVFAAMFSHDLQETNTNILDLKDVSPDTMENVIQYIYSGRCHKLEGMAAEILPVADKYGLEKLKLMCEEMLCFQLDLNNIVTMLCLADMHSTWKLKETCIDFICSNCKNVLETSEWKRMTSMNKDLALEIKSALIDKNLLMKKIRLAS